MKRTLRTLAALSFGALAALVLAPAAAQAVGTSVVSVVNSPDDTVGGAPWARDTFVRTTSFSTIDGGFSVSIWDNGTFKTPTGVTGKLDGHGTWTITGGTAKTPVLPSTIDRSSVALKDSFTGEWWKRFVDGGEVKTFTWEWKYKSECWKPSFRETRIESSAKGSIGERPTKVCPAKPTPPAKPTVTATVTPTVTATATPTKTATTSASATPSKTATATPSKTTTAGAVFTTMPNNGGTEGGLPVTGPSMGMLIAAGSAVIGTGIVLTILVRRRKVRFAA